MRDLIGTYENSIDSLRLKPRVLTTNTLILGEEGSGKTNLACRIRNFVIDNDVPTLYLDFSNSHQEEVELRYKDEHFHYIQYDETEVFMHKLQLLVAQRKHIYMAVNPNFFATKKDIKSKLTQTLQMPELLENYYYFFHDIANLNGFYTRFEDFLLYMLSLFNLKKYGITFLTQPHTIFENAQLKLLFTFLYVGKCSNLDYYNTAVLKTLQKNHFLFQQRTANRTLLFNDIKTSMVLVNEYLMEE
ncbi:MAG: ATP-binding protein [Thiovulaceae bacterium]|nr:ATP-binding protein [Sulfurimonadaceae bacterium]